MKIGPVDSGEWRAKPRDTQESQIESGNTKQKPTASEDSATIGDSVTLSNPVDEQSPPTEEDEASADEAADDESEREEAEAEQAKVDEVIKREQEGFYNRPEIKEQIARRIADDLMG